MAKHASKTIAAKKRRARGAKAAAKPESPTVDGTEAASAAPKTSLQGEQASGKAKAAAAQASSSIRDAGASSAPKSKRRPSFRRRKSSEQTLPPAPLPNVLTLLKTSLVALRAQWKLFLGILVVYAVLNVLFVQSIASFDTAGVKNNLDQLFGGSSAKVTSATALFTYMLGSTNSPSSDGAVYQLVFLVIISLALIRALREVYDGRTPTVRDVFYTGMSPLVPFLLVLLLIGAELIPLTIGASLYSLVMSNGIAVYLAEKIFWLLELLGFAAVSLYLIASSLMALYIATQPGMTPMRAIRAARRVTRRRHWSIVGRLLFLPVVLALATAVVIIPAILIVPALAAPITLAGMIVGLAIIHSYLFALLRSVLA